MKPTPKSLAFLAFAVTAASTPAFGAAAVAKYTLDFGRSGFGSLCILDNGKAHGLIRYQGKPASFSANIEDGRFAISVKERAGVLSAEFFIAFSDIGVSATLAGEPITVSVAPFSGVAPAFSNRNAPVTVTIRDESGDSQLSGVLTAGGKFVPTTRFKTLLKLKYDKTSGLVNGKLGGSAFIGIVSGNTISAICDDGARVLLRTPARVAENVGASGTPTTGTTESVNLTAGPRVTGGLSPVETNISAISLPTLNGWSDGYSSGTITLTKTGSNGAVTFNGGGIGISGVSSGGAIRPGNSPGTLELGILEFSSGLEKRGPLGILETAYSPHEASGALLLGSPLLTETIPPRGATDVFFLPPVSNGATGAFELNGSSAGAVVVSGGTISLHGNLSPINLPQQISVTNGANLNLDYINPFGRLAISLSGTGQVTAASFLNLVGTLNVAADWVNTQTLGVRVGDIFLPLTPGMYPLSSIVVLPAN